MLPRSPRRPPDSYDPLRRTRGMVKAGKKARANAKANRERKPKFERAEIVTCEFRYEGCGIDYHLTWAHGRKRRKLLPGELEEFCALACAFCHRKLDEEMSHEEMAAEVRRVIDARERRAA